MPVLVSFILRVYQDAGDTSYYLETIKKKVKNSFTSYFFCNFAPIEP